MSADLDKAIDRAVREMLDVEPRADLRARVLAHIDEPRGGVQWPRSGLQRVAALVGAAAVLVLVLVLGRLAEPPAQPPVLAGARVPEPLTVAGTPQPPIRVPAAPTPLAARGAVVAEVPARTAYAASVATTEATAIDPLTAIAPIEVAPIGHSSIAPAPIGVRPLDPITEMQIAPLNPPDGRD